MRPTYSPAARQEDETGPHHPGQDEGLDYTEGSRLQLPERGPGHLPEYLVARKMMQIAMLENVIDYNAIPSRGWRSRGSGWVTTSRE